jgi:hypothetical protein
MSYGVVARVFETFNRLKVLSIRRSPGAMGRANDGDRAPSRSAWVVIRRADDMRATNHGVMPERKNLYSGKGFEHRTAIAVTTGIRPVGDENAN